MLYNEQYRRLKKDLIEVHIKLIQTRFSPIKLKMQDANL